MKIVDKVIGKAALPVIMIAGTLLIIAIVFSTQSTDKDNNAYIRVINCIISKNAATRTQSDIEQCYSIVEHDLGIKLQRYDSSK